MKYLITRNLAYICGIWLYSFLIDLLPNQQSKYSGNSKQTMQIEEAKQSDNRQLSHERISSQYKARWIVMGTSRTLIESAIRSLASARFSTLCCITILLLIVCAQSGESSCSVDKCSERYKKATHRLEKAREKDPSANLSHRQCNVLKKLHRCLHKIRRVCRGNLLYHSIKHINDRDQKKYNCTKIPPAPPSYIPEPPMDPGDIEHQSNETSPPLTTTLSTLPREGSVCTYAGKAEYKHCGMFGDPHLRTFLDEFYTCKVEGTWPLINNDYIVVMVTNVPVKEGSSATVTTKITVVIKSAGVCAGHRHYIASSGRLPGAFDDGSSAVGSVEVVEKEPGKLVEIHAHFIGTTVIIRQVSRYLTFAIRMPKEFINGVSSQKQLCVQGCPVGHQITPPVTNSKRNSKNSKNHNSAVSTLPLNDMTGEEQASTYSPSKPSPPPNAIEYFSETEARLKCKEILLDLTKNNNLKTGQLEHVEPEDEALASAAFSSLESLPEESRREKKKSRMAAARRLDSDVLQSSFTQLRGLKESTGSTRNKRNAKRNKKRSGNTTAPKSTSCKNKKERKSLDSNFYFESCVFDLMTTGDIDFTLAAKAAFDDVRRTHVMRDDAPGTSLEVVRMWEPIPQQDPNCPEAKDGDPGGNGSASTTPVCNLTILFCVLLSCIYINMVSLANSIFVTVKSINIKKTKYLDCKNEAHTSNLITCKST